MTSYLNPQQQISYEMSVVIHYPGGCEFGIPCFHASILQKQLAANSVCLYKQSLIRLECLLHFQSACLKCVEVGDVSFHIHQRDIAVP